MVQADCRTFPSARGLRPPPFRQALPPTLPKLDSLSCTSKKRRQSPNLLKAPFHRSRSSTRVCKGRGCVAEGPKGSHALRNAISEENFLSLKCALQIRPFRLTFLWLPGTHSFRSTTRTLASPARFLNTRCTTPLRVRSTTNSLTIFRTWPPVAVPTRQRVPMP